MDAGSKCIQIQPTVMDVEDKCAYPMHKSYIDGKWTCDRCPLTAPYAKYDDSKNDTTVCVSYSECGRPEVHYFAELDQSFAICSDKPTRFDFKSNGQNVTIISRAVSMLNGMRYVAEVTSQNMFLVRLETEKDKYAFGTGDVEYVRSYNGEGFILRKKDGQFY